MLSGEDLELLLGAGALVFADLPLLDHVVDLFLGNLDGLLHLFLGLEHGFVDHQDSSSAVTSVPIFSPRMALAILPSPSIPNTIIGSLFSEHNANAAASTTRRPCCSASSYEIRSSLRASGSLRGSAL